MPDKKDLLNKRKQSLLVELESIKRLLDDESDMIPILDETVVEDDDGNYQSVDRVIDSVIVDSDLVPNLSGEPVSEFSPTLDDEPSKSPLSEFAPESILERENQEESPIRDKSVLPGQQSLFDNKTASSSPSSPSQTPNTNKPAKALGDNPFLPKHVRQRLGKQSGTPLGNMTAQQIAGNNPSYTERLVDQLVAKHLPRIEAELRKKLLDAVNMKTEQQTGKQPAQNSPKKSL